MGGDREINTPTKASEGQSIGNLRIHENNGEIHFHDDAASLKVAVPSADMFDAWEKLATGRREKFKYIDATNGTELRIKIAKVKRKKRPDLTDAFFEIRPAKKSKLLSKILSQQTTPEFDRFDKFIKG